MNDGIDLLVIEDDEGDKYLLQQVMLGTKGTHYNLCMVNRLSNALEMLNQRNFNAILMDLGLPDSSGIKTFEEIYNNCREIPIIILSGLADEAIALKAVRRGAQDYLMKSEIAPGLLKRVINHSIERNLLQRKLSKISMTDELTGLYNRRGFLKIAKQNMDLAQRLQKKVGLFLLDIDGMKEINDLFGHMEGDQALIDISSILNDSCRKTDVIGRLGGDEFVVFSFVDCDDNLQMLANRIKDRTVAHNNSAGRKYMLSVSLGTLCIDPDGSIDIQRSLDEADKLMYTEKMGKRTGRFLDIQKKISVSL